MGEYDELFEQKPTGGLQLLPSHKPQLEDAPASSEYDDLFPDNQGSALGVSMYNASFANPDEEARRQKLATALDMRPSHIPSIPDGERDLWRKQYDTMSLRTSNPRLSAWLEDEDNAKVAKDDLDNLGVLENIFAQRSPLAKTIDSKVSDYARSIGRGFIGQGAGSYLSGFAETGKVMGRMGARVLPEPVAEKAQAAQNTLNLVWDTVFGLTKGGQQLKAVGEEIAPPAERRGLDTEVASAIGQIAFQLPLYRYGGPLGQAGLAFQGVDMMSEKTRGDSYGDLATDIAKLMGGGFTMATERWGLDMLLNRVPPQIKDRAFRFAADKVIAGGVEASQEFFEGLLHDTAYKVLVNPDAPMLEGVVEEMTVAGLAAAIVRTAVGIKPYRRAKEDEQFFTALGDTAKASALRERLPEKFQELVDRYTADGPVQQVFVNAERFTEYFQSAGANPTEIAQQIGSTDYAEALALGSDMSIPMSGFVRYIAPADSLQGLMPDLKIDPLEMSAREYEQSSAEREEALKAELADMERQVAEDVPARQVFDDVYGQLLAIGHDEGRARMEATLVASNINARAKSLSMDPWTLYQERPLTIAREMPTILKRLREHVDTTLDPYLDELRSLIQQGKKADPDAGMGLSLSDFLRNQGGLVDDAGELKARDVDRERKPFKKKLIQKKGLPIDRARELALEAGYPVGDTPATFLDALDAELRGTPVFSDQNIDWPTVDRLTALQEMQRAVDTAGIDLLAVDNEQVKKLLFGSQRAEIGQGVEFEQAASYQQWEKAVEDVALDKPLKGMLQVMDVPDVLKSLGAEDRPIKITIGVIKKVLKGKHQERMSAEILKQIPAALANPVMVFESASDPRALVVMLNLRNLDGQTIIVPVQLEAKESWHEVNVITSIYGKNRDSWFIDQIKAGRLRYWDKEKSFEWARLAGLQSPLRNSIQNSTNNILSKEDVVKGREFFQSAPLWYSPLQRSIESAKQATATGRDWKAIIAKLPGVKSAEIEAVGLNEWLDVQQGQVTKEQVLDYVRQNGVQVQEVVKGIDRRAAWQKEMDRINDRYNEIVDLHGAPIQNLPVDAKAEIDSLTVEHDRIADLMAASRLSEDATKFHSYTLPGGENYRELLLTLPVKLRDSRTSAIETRLLEIKARLDEIRNEPAEKVGLEEQTLWREQEQLAAEARSIAFLSSHFDEPNILAHVRFNERTDTDGKRVLFLEEIQSDWSAANRNALKELTKPQSVWKLANDVLGAKMASVMPLNQVDGGVLAALKHDQVRRTVIAMVNNLVGGKFAPEDFFRNPDMLVAHLSADHLRTVSNGLLDAMRRVGASLRAELLAARAAGRDGEILPALNASDLDTREVVGLLAPERLYHVGLPVRGGIARLDSEVSPTSLTSFIYWHSNILRQAGASTQVLPAPFIEKTEGYVALVFKRMIRYAAENGFDRVAWTTGEQQADRYDISKKIDAIRYAQEGEKYSLSLIRDAKELAHHEVRASDLDDAVGKELAAKIRKGEGKDIDNGKELSGLDLKVGGEGMKAFYDRIVPQVASDIIKKLGGKVEAVELDRTQVAKDGSGDTRIRPGAPHFQPGFSITPAMRESALQGMPLFQRQNDPRAKYNPLINKITLLKNADFSSFVHELGHSWLDDLMIDAQRENATDRLKGDAQVILEWFGVKDIATWQAMDIEARREHHEKFAQGFEVYVREGKAPSSRLREVFFSFGQWLKRLYKSVTGMVELTPEVRGVMDRMLATDEEIAAAEKDVDTAPLFTDAKAAGMTEAEFAVYRKVAEEAHMEAREKLLARAMAEFDRQQKDWWKTERARVKGEVTEEVDNTPVYRVLAWLRYGKPEAAGIEHVRMSRDALVKMYGEEFTKRLPMLSYQVDGGMHPDIMAEMFGFESGDAMVRALIEARPRNPLIEAETDRRMVDLYGDMLHDGTMPEKAKEAVLGEGRQKVVMAELAALRRKQREVAPYVKAAKADAREQAREGMNTVRGVPSQADIRKAVEQTIAAKKVRDIKPQSYMVAARKAARLALEAAVKDNYAEAARQKEAELLNLEMYRQAVEAQGETERIAKHMLSLTEKKAQERLGKAGGDYLEQITSLVDRFEFRKVPIKVLAKRASLAEWIKEKEMSGESMGEEIVISDQLRNEALTVNYKDMTYAELLDLRDTVRQIEHMAKFKNRLLAAKKNREWQDVRVELVNAIQDNLVDRGEPPFSKSGLSRMQALGKRVAEFDASLLKMEQLVEWLDGGDITGPWHTYFWNGAADAQAAEYDYTAKVTAKIAAAVLNIPKEIRARMMEKVEIAGVTRPMTRRDLIGVALNAGNESNLDKMMRGMGWRQFQIQEMIDRLTAEEIAFVNTIHATLESMWPDIAQLQKELTGLEPEKIDPRPFEAANGTIAGGYYPVIYDPLDTEQGQLQLSNRIGGMTDDAYVRATTPKGHTKARIQRFAAPLDLDIDNLPHHIAGVVKDLTHRKWLLDANKIANNRDIRAALRQHMGDEYVRLFGDWTRSVISDRNIASNRSLNIWRRTIEGFRYNVMVAAMGFKATTMLSQFAGIGMSIETIGGKELDGRKYFLRGFNEVVRRPRALYAWVTEKSGEMRHRFETRDRDMRDKLRLLEGRTDVLAQVQDMALHGIGLFDMMVSLPTWYGAYLKGLDQGLSEDDAIRNGDRAVRLSQGAGGAKDLSAVMSRSDTLMRTLTMFYTPFSALYSRLRDIGHDFGGIKDVPQAAVRLWWVWIIPAVMGEIASGRWPDDDDEEGWAEWLTRTIGIYPTLAIPLLRDIASATVSKYGYTFTPVAQVGEQTAYLAQTAMKVAEGEKDLEDLAKKLFQVSGYYLGLPTKQVEITGSYLYDLWTGEEDPDDLGEFARDMLYRRK